MKSSVVFKRLLLKSGLGTMCVRQCHDNCVRVRFAPSPTGQLHLGGLRTALYNYLFAKRLKGKYLLRIEDTDQTRLVPGAVEKLVDVLAWAGIEFDEGPHIGGNFGPYVQSQRLALYSEMAEVLLKKGAAYRCFCSAERLELLRKDQARRREVPRYDNRCRTLTQAEIDSKLAANIPYVVRLRLEHSKEPWHDVVYGPITYDVADVEGDAILLKTDKYPTYHLANVVDDHFMKITHILRGVEWQVSTAKHILLYKAFGWQPPQIGHLPLLLNKDGSKLSKRQNDVTVEHYKNLSYSPEAVLNLITYTGSGFDVQDTRGFTLPRLVEHFDLSKLNTNSSKLDMERVNEFNRMHIRDKFKSEQLRRLLVGQVRDLISSKLRDKLGSSDVQKDALSDAYIEHILLWAQDRIDKLEDLAGPKFEFLWVISDRVSQNQSPLSVEVLQKVIEALQALPGNQVTSQSLPSDFWHQLASQQSLRYEQLMSALRKTISGLKVGPPVVELMGILGKRNTVRRLEHAVTMATQNKCSTADGTKASNAQR